MKRKNPRLKESARDIAPGISVDVKDGNFEKAFRKFNKKVKDEKLMKEIFDRQYYEKPSERKRKERLKARKKWLRKLSKMEQKRR